MLLKCRPEKNKTETEYCNDAYYAKGMIKSTVVKDRAGRVYARTKNAINTRYAYYDAGASVRYEGREYGQGTNAEINFYLKGRKSSFESISK